MSGSPLFPPIEDAHRYAIKPGSVVWRRASDVRTMVGAGTALVLQVAHPTVAAGVGEHSTYKRDPWGRLLRSLDYVNLLVYGEPRVAARVGRRLREMHQKINGVAPDGTRYHALEREAFAWVHASTIDTLVRSHAAFGTPMGGDELEELWADWVAVGRLLGIRPGDLPATWAEYGSYLDALIDDRLGDSAVLRDVLETLGAQATPPPSLPGPLWTVLQLPAMRTLHVASVGLLPERLRTKLDLPWSLRDQVDFRLLSVALRAATPVMPSSLRRSGPDYLRRRERAIAGGDFGRDGGGGVAVAA